MTKIESTTYTYQGPEIDTIQVEAQKLVMDRDAVAERTRLRFASMEAGYPGLIGNGHLSAESAVAYITDTVMRRKEPQFDDPTARQLIARQGPQTRGLIEYGSTLHPRNQGLTDQKSDVPGVHIETLALPEHQGTKYMQELGGVMLHALTFDADEASHIRYRVTDVHREDFDALLADLDLQDVVRPTTYTEGNRFPGAQPEEMSALGRTLYVADRLSLRQGLEQNFPATQTLVITNSHEHGWPTE